MKIMFPIERVREQLDHAEKAPSHSPTWDDLVDASKWKPGTTPNAHGWVESKDIDPAKIPARLDLVKDEGIYLMSNGAPRWIEPGTKHSKVVYGLGYGPDADYGTLVAAVGGDDFALPLDAADVRELVNHEGMAFFWVEVTDTHIAFGACGAE